MYRDLYKKNNNPILYLLHEISERFYINNIIIKHSQLPVKIDIIKHPNETDGKSTAVHAKLIAPDDVTIYTYPCIPEYEEERHNVSSFYFIYMNLPCVMHM